MGLLALGGLVTKLFEGQAWWVIATPIYWVAPLQTVICGGLLIHYWPHYQFRRPSGIGLTLGIAIGVFLIWISPQELFHFAPRIDGFQPHFFSSEGWPYAANLGMRLARLVIVVPLVEEIFWRGFLLRYVISENFTEVPIGKFQWTSFGLVTLAFTLVHSMPDMIPAAITGALYNLIAYRTRQVSSCVLAHAATNLLLGLYILKTGQWGFW